MNKFQKIASARKVRNDLLCKTDKYMLEDFPLSVLNKAELLEYRQALRDITENTTDGEAIQFPAPPSWFKG